MPIITENSMHAKLRANPIDNINTIANDVSMLLKRNQQFLNLGTIKLCANGDGKCTV